MAVWLLIACVTLYAWEMSHFQVLQSVHENGPWLLRNGVELGGPAAVILLALVALYYHTRSNARLGALCRGYLWLAAFTLVVSSIWGGPIQPRYVAQAMVFAFTLERVLDTRARLLRFLWGNALAGIACAALNTVPLLHFKGIVTLPTSYIDRAGAGFEQSGIKILSFGPFGRADWEMYPVPGVWWNRLHGWSFEPIHWAYFMLWTAVCCLLLLSQPAGRYVQRFLRAALVLLAVHLYFVYSAAAFIVLALTAFTVLWHTVTSGVSRKLSLKTLYLGIVLGAGLIGPIVLAVTPRFAQLIPEEAVLSKGENWESKLGFVRLGSAILTRLMPDPALADGAGHNLVLSTYLAFGFLGVLPLLAFEWRFLKHTVRSQERYVQVAALLSLVSINHQVPPALFYPLGAIWVVSIGQAARHPERQRAPLPVALAA